MSFRAVLHVWRVAIVGSFVVALGSTCGPGFAQTFRGNFDQPCAYSPCGGRVPGQPSALTDPSRDRRDCATGCSGDNRPRYVQVFRDDFNEPCARFPCDTNWWVYPASWTDTSGNGRYD